MSLCTCSPGA